MLALFPTCISWVVLHRLHQAFQDLDLGVSMVLDLLIMGVERAPTCVTSLALPISIEVLPAMLSSME